MFRIKKSTRLAGFILLGLINIINKTLDTDTMIKLVKDVGDA